MHGMPAGLPCGIPGMGEVIEGAMQHAPQPERQSMPVMLPRSAVGCKPPGRKAGLRKRS